jgi:hypothetical protein
MWRWTTRGRRSRTSGSESRSRTEGSESRSRTDRTSPHHSLPQVILRGNARFKTYEP